MDIFALQILLADSLGVTLALGVSVHRNRLYSPNVSRQIGDQCESFRPCSLAHGIHLFVQTITQLYMWKVMLLLCVSMILDLNDPIPFAGRLRLGGIL